MHSTAKKLLWLLGIMVAVSVMAVAVTWAVAYTEPEIKEEKFTVVTSFYPIYVAALNVIDETEGVELSNLTENKGGCLHDYQLTVADMKKLEGADVLIINGGGMESFLENIKKAYPDLRIIDASAKIVKEENGEEENAHYWMDPARYRIQLETICKELTKIDPKRAESYEKGLANYEEKLLDLEESIEEVKKEIPAQSAVLFHDAFAYLAERLGISVAYSIELEEDTSLNTGEIAEIVDIIKEKQVHLLFTEKQFSEDIPLAISRETDSDICVVDTLVSGELTKDAYLEGMYNNLKIIKESVK